MLRMHVLAGKRSLEVFAGKLIHILEFPHSMGHKILPAYPFSLLRKTPTIILLPHTFILLLI